jgi:hypothetical protein
MKWCLQKLIDLKIGTVLHGVVHLILDHHDLITFHMGWVKVKVKVKQSLYRPGVAQRVPGS